MSRSHEKKGKCGCGRLLSCSVCALPGLEADFISSSATAFVSAFVLHRASRAFARKVCTAGFRLKSNDIQKTTATCETHVTIGSFHRTTPLRETTEYDRLVSHLVPRRSGRSNGHSCTAQQGPPVLVIPSMTAALRDSHCPLTKRSLRHMLQECHAHHTLPQKPSLTSAITSKRPSHLFTPCCSPSTSLIITGFGSVTTRLEPAGGNHAHGAVHNEGRV